MSDRTNIHLEPKEILQINVTVIAGALIFLTVLTTSPTTLPGTLNQLTAMTVSLGIILVFSFSSLFAAAGSILSAVNTMKAGFIVLKALH